MRQDARIVLVECGLKTLNQWWVFHDSKGLKIRKLLSNKDKIFLEEFWFYRLIKIVQRQSVAGCKIVQTKKKKASTSSYLKTKWSKSWLLTKKTFLRKLVFSRPFLPLVIYTLSPLLRNIIRYGDKTGEVWSSECSSSNLADSPGFIS